MPKEQPDGKQQISVRLTAEALKMVDEQVRYHGSTRTEIIERAVRFYARAHPVQVEQ